MNEKKGFFEEESKAVRNGVMSIVKVPVQVDRQIPGESRDLKDEKDSVDVFSTGLKVVKASKDPVEKPLK